MNFSIIFVLFCLFTCYKCADKKERSSDDKQDKTLLTKEIEKLSKQSNLEQIIIDILYNHIKFIKCFAIMCDSMYCNIFTSKMYKKFKLRVTYFMIQVDDYEDLFSPYNETQESLNQVKTEGCKFYVILIANGLQVSRFLRFADRYRVINTRANFIMLYDIRLFQKNLHYIWTRIVNVIFIREYSSSSNLNKVTAMPWFDLSTVPFPSPIQGVFIPRRLDTWRRGHFRLGVDLFTDKTSDLRGQTLKVVTFQHIPAMKKQIIYYGNSTDNENITIVYSGMEVEILQTLAEQMNFETSIYEADNAEVEKWGRRLDNKFSGLLGEMVKFQAEIALGDLHYTPYHLELMDLTIPYNTECLTFLTPESSTDNSWLTLILPFKFYMWLTVILVILVMGFIFHVFAKIQRFFYENSKETNCIVFESKTVKADILREKTNSPVKHVEILKRKLELVETEEKPMGLYLFEEWFNSFLYTYSMLLLISLPRVPDGWSLRVIVGWYFIYTTLVVVSYKASMTSILTNPAPKITIDSLEELEESELACGGWAETVKDFFLTSLDSSSQKIGQIFEHVNDTESAIERVAKGEFAYYENVYYLKAAAVKRELQMQLQRHEDSTIEDTDRNLHIMTHCVINMPISLGLQKNSPIKPKVDIFIRRVIESGFVKKWLDDVMQPTLTSEMNIDPEKSTALMTLEKLYAGIAALFTGYFISFTALGIELAYWHFVVKKNPFFDKYSNRILVPIQK